MSGSVSGEGARCVYCTSLPVTWLMSGCLLAMSESISLCTRHPWAAGNRISSLDLTSLIQRYIWARRYDPWYNDVLTFDLILYDQMKGQAVISKAYTVVLKRLRIPSIIFRNRSSNRLADVSSPPEHTHISAQSFTEHNNIASSFPAYINF